MGKNAAKAQMTSLNETDVTSVLNGLANLNKRIGATCYRMIGILDPVFCAESLLEEANGSTEAIEQYVETQQELNKVTAER